MPACEPPEWEASIMDSDFDAYQSGARATAVYPGQGEHIGILYPALGLAGEAGEVAEKVKKLWRNDGLVLTEEKRDAIIAELGDVLWYVAAMCSELGSTMHEVAQRNLAKLADRQARGVLKSEGDQR